MSRRSSLLVVMSTVLVCLCLGAQTNTGPEPVQALSQPSLSPDGSMIAFAAGGDIWTAPAAGGVGRLLISDPALESRPVYSPDGKWLAFNSNRTGFTSVFLFELATGQLRRLTYEEGNDVLDGWSADSRWVYFDTTSHNVAGSNDVYRISVEGGTPMPITTDRYVNEFFGAAAPDGSVAFAVRGLASAQWWRNGTSHIDETEIWRWLPATSTYERLVSDGAPDGAKQLWPMFSADGKTLYYTSTKGGTENLWSVTAGGQPRKLTDFTSGRLLWPTMGAGGSAIVFQRDFGVWKYDVKSGKAAPVAIHLLGSPAAPGIEHLNVTTAQNMAVSPDGRKAVFTAHGELFAVGVDAGGQAIRVTHSGRLQFDPVWLNDSRSVIYISDRTGHDHIYQYDFVSGSETALTQGDSDECHLALSPDGKTLAYQRGTTDVMSLDLTGHQSTQIAKGYFGRPPLGGGTVFAWAPDSKWLAYLSESDGTFRNAYVVAATGGDSKEVTFIPNANSGDLSWSPDGKFLLLTTSQRTETSRIARVDLTPRTPFFAEDRFHDLFDNPPNGASNGARGGRSQGDSPDQTPAPARRATPPVVNVVYDGISRRMSLLPMTDARGPKISPDGHWLVYVATDGATGGRGGGSIYLYSLDDEAAPGATAGGGRGGRGGADAAPAGPRALVTTPGAKSDLQFTADSRQLFFLEAGRISHVDVGTTGAAGAAQVRTVNTTADLDVDFAQEKEEVFEQAWRYLRDGYMNPAMNGADWNAVHARYAPVVAGASTPEDLRQVLSLMIGDLNSSHSGIMAGGAGAATAGTRRPTTGRIGVFFDRKAYEDQGKLCVTEVVPLGPAAVAGVKTGDCLIKINDVTVGPRTDEDRLMEDQVGHKVELTLQNRSVSLKPISGAEEKNLLYDAWVEHNRLEVEKLSNGGLGYVHMIDMSQQSLDRLYLDLDSTNFSRRGVVIDVRNNTGGFVNAYALDVLTRRPYITMTPRGFPQGPARVSLGQRALEKPTVLITNQNSLSDSEDFTEGYRAMQLGKVVGVPTAGWIIFTSNVDLIDGSSVRLPFTRVLDHEGKDMELHPRAVDVEVQNPIGSWAQGKDAQLEAAVKTLMTQLPAAPAAARSTTNGGQ